MRASETCPLCASALSDPKPVEVCSSCHHGIEMSLANTLSATGEFTAITDPTIGTSPPSARTTHAGVACTWCNKPVADVKKMLTQADSHICNECVYLCADILRMELGDDFGS